MNRQQFQRFIDRDQHCPHCGTTGDTLVPQHRANRGHGGHKAGNAPSNIIVLCSLINGLIESNANWASLAREYGWKLRRHEDPADTPFFDMAHGGWWTIDNDYGRKRAI